MARHRRRGRRNRYDWEEARSGVATTIDTLRDFGERVTEAAKRALREGAEQIAADAKARCPVDTGKLRDSIHVESNREQTSFRIVADAKDENGFAYGKIVEFSPKINKPFMYPAYEDNYARVTANIKDAIKQSIREGQNQ